MQSEKITVTTVEMARFLTEGASYLAPFALQPETVSGAAQRLELPLGRVHYWVQKAAALGLLQVTHQLQRAGRPQKFYLTAARAFFVPAHLLDIERRMTQELSTYRQYLQAVERVQPDLLGYGPLTVRFDEQGASLNFGEQGWSGAALHIRSGTLHLLPEDACSLKEELSAVFARYYVKHSEASQTNRYLVHIGVVASKDEGA